jgi:hypothetical protein
MEDYIIVAAPQVIKIVIGGDKWNYPPSIFDLILKLIVYGRFVAVKSIYVQGSIQF